MKKVLVGVSGGVDSSVALLLLKKDYDVSGCCMKLNSFDSDKDAKDVCSKLGINYINLDLTSEFRKIVKDYFIEEYSNCRTPNPCVVCNKKIKFDLFYKYAMDNGYDFIATGHYAKIEYSNKYNRYVLKKADNTSKDQSYFLYNIKKERLPNIIFPLSNFSDKEEIRKTAKDNNLNIYSKSDSQDICFIQDGDYKKYLEEENIKKTPGNIILNKEVIGRHTGLYKYTIGQRKGLGISYKNPLFVIGFNKEKNELLVGEEKDLYTKSFKVKDYNLLLFDNIEKPIKVKVKTRYRSIEKEATIIEKDNYINVEFDKLQKGVTSGQSAVFYIDDIVVGGGIIE